MKKSLAIIATVIMPFFVMAQNSTKQQEVGIVFSNVNNFGLTYRIGTDNALWRFNTVFISGGDSKTRADSLAINRSDLGFGISVGREYRKRIVENLELRYGVDLSFRYSQDNYSYLNTNGTDRTYESNTTTYQPGINLIFGLNYLFNSKLVVGAELLPGFSYKTGETERRENEEITKIDISGFNYGLSNTSLLLSVVYRY